MNPPPTREYWPRIADESLRRILRRSGAVVIEGPRACGKTATALQVAASQVLLDRDAQARAAAAVDPGLILAGETPRLIDEWQLVPAVWNHVRRAVDDRPGRGHFILTGSAVPPDDSTRHSGAGRVTRLRLRPMSLMELRRSSGNVSLASLLAGGPASGGAALLDTRELAELICVGGWPGHLGSPAGEAPLTPGDAIARNRAYLDEVRHTDVRRVDGVARDPVRLGRLLESLAHNVATSARLSTLARDTAGAEGAVNERTVSAYHQALTRLMVVEDQPPWTPDLRSCSRLRMAPKRHFADPSLAVAALKASPEHLLRDFEWFGLLFESLVVRDLRAYAQASEAGVFHYRDNTGLEVDAIVDAGPGRWAAFEIKLGASRIDDAARTLLRFAERVDPRHVGEPAALGVIVGSGYAYTRPDGVSVIPVAALGP